MISDTYTASRNTTYKRVTIVTVDMNNLKVQGIDSTNATYFIDCSLQPGVVVIPREGDDWFIARYGELWKLMFRYEKSDDKTPINRLAPGDVRIEGKKIYLNGSVFINGNKQAGNSTIYGETPSGLIDGSNAIFYLKYVNEPGTIRIFVNGLRIYNFTAKGTEIEFDVAPLINSVIKVDYDVSPENAPVPASDVLMTDAIIDEDLSVLHTLKTTEVETDLGSPPMHTY